MTTKAEFNAEDWTLIVEGAPYAALRVVMAAPGGALREMLSIGRAYAEERENHANSELLDAVVAEQPSVNPNRYADADAMTTETLGRLREAVAILKRTGTTIEVDDYKRFTYALAERVARTHKEGGFLGVGGREISEGERQALDEIASALGYEPGTDRAD